MTGHDDHNHVLPLSMYFGIFGTLMVLTVVTVGAAFIDLGSLNIVVAIAIAIVKATLVILFFMHLKYGARLNWVVVGAGLFWFAILLGMLMLDYSSRGWMNVPQIVHPM